MNLAMDGLSLTDLESEPTKTNKVANCNKEVQPVLHTAIWLHSYAAGKRKGRFKRKPDFPKYTNVFFG